jgi:hypothetical protein
MAEERKKKLAELRARRLERKEQEENTGNKTVDNI